MYLLHHGTCHSMQFWGEASASFGAKVSRHFLHPILFTSDPLSDPILCTFHTLLSAVSIQLHFLFGEITHSAVSLGIWNICAANRFGHSSFSVANGMWWGIWLRSEVSWETGCTGMWWTHSLWGQVKSVMIRGVTSFQVWICIQWTL